MRQWSGSNISVQHFSIFSLPTPSGHNTPQCKRDVCENLMKRDPRNFSFQINKFTMAAPVLKCHFCKMETVVESEYLEHVKVSLIKFTLFPSIFASTP